MREPSYVRELLHKAISNVMPTGHFQIGDLSFSYEGSFEELAQCQSVMREFRQAEHRLKTAAGSDKVYLIYDQDLQGDSGAFDKLRLRSYDDENNYTMDIGSTSKNPLGIFPGLKDDKNIHVYHRETGERWEITPDGEVVGKSEASAKSNGPQRERSSSEQDPGGNSMRSHEDQRRSSAGGNRSNSGKTREKRSGKAEGWSDDPDERARTIIKKAEVHPDDKGVGETSLTSGELAEEIRWYADACNRGNQYMAQVLNYFGVETVEDLRIGDVRETFRLIHSEAKLQKRSKKAQEKAA